ncbi:nicotinic acetylcholine receptor beta2 subunit [Calliopsis andreniformis]|uniref:nicotinic acetylcholine receptor beta2 subunit n=1 Tax=Calliopsis andreniformis TaxID=337506 RepID=UPI003FCE01BA
MWTDPHLTWEPSLFDSIDAIRVMSYEIWVPDVTLHSATNQYVDINMPTVRCYLYHQGTLYCVPMTVYTTHCESDHTWWPYDLMNCSIHIASWSYSNDEIDVRFMHVQRESQKVYENNLQWDIVEIHQSEHTINSKFGLGFASKLLSFHIFLKRHSSMYSQIYLTLAIVLMAMTLMVLWLDPRSIERMIIANLNLILHLFSLQDLQWKIPSNGTALPKLLIFYENSFILATFSLMLTNILRCIQQLKVQAPVWISSASISIFNSRIGQVLLMNILDPHISARMELYADDNTILVTSTERSGTWKYISILIGWFAFTSILFVYIIMLVLLLPTSTHNSHIKSGILYPNKNQLNVSLFFLFFIRFNFTMFPLNKLDFQYKKKCEMLIMRSKLRVKVTIMKILPLVRTYG